MVLVGAFMIVVIVVIVVIVAAGLGLLGGFLGLGFGCVVLLVLAGRASETVAC